LATDRQADGSGDRRVERSRCLDVVDANGEEVMGLPAWKTLPSWYLVAQDDEALPPDAQRQFATRMGATTVEVPSSHVAMVSHADEVTRLILDASAAVTRSEVLSASE
jgi:pimeloyl-ACP methyl ester carboxylesterase